MKLLSLESRNRPYLLRGERKVTEIPSVETVNLQGRDG